MAVTLDRLPIGSIPGSIAAMRILLLAAAALLAAMPAQADDGTPTSPEMVKEFSGKWQVQDAEAARTCDVVLDGESAIGGYAIDVAADCAKAFPVMDEIAAWRLYENGEIVFADFTRKERLRFFTPDDSYVSVEEVDGIVRLIPASQ
ncbi:MAG: hypothetical protein FJX63_04360 [Alphaproteobacteria bacterium]|nr:hypothetical protein [Alphaproteobacteria bacterium]